MGVVYALYENPNLFPVAVTDHDDSSTRRTVVGSPVIAATVGRGIPFNNLYSPVVIELELSENEDDTVSVFSFLVASYH